MEHDEVHDPSHVDNQEAQELIRVAYVEEGARSIATGPRMPRFLGSFGGTCRRVERAWRL